MKTPKNQNHTIVFRAASVFVFALLLISTIAANTKKVNDPVTSFFSTISSVIFDTPSGMPASQNVLSPGNSFTSGDPILYPPIPPKPSQQ